MFGWEVRGRKGSGRKVRYPNAAEVSFQVRHWLRDAWESALPPTFRGPQTAQSLT